MLPSGALPVFPHCPSSVCSRRSATNISSLPQQCSLQQEPFPPAPPLPVTHNGPSPLPFPTAPRHHRNPPPAVSSLPQQCLLQQEPSLYFPTAAAVPAPTGIFSIFPHCPSSDCSCRSTIYFPTTAVVSAPAGALSIFPTAAAVPAPAGVFSTFPHCPSSVCSSRSATCISSLPQ